MSKTTPDINLTKHVVIGFSLMILLTYSFAWVELIERNQLLDGWVNNIKLSIQHWFGWILPYWWFLIILGTLGIAILGYFLNYAIKKINN